METKLLCMKKNYLYSILFFLFVGIAANAQNFPVAADDNVTTIVSSPVTIYFLDNDTFGDDGLNADPVSIISNPQHGEAQLFNSPIAGGEVVFSITYTPYSGFVGVDSFLYTIKDANGDISTATIFISVENNNFLTQAVDDYFYTTENVQIECDVLINDSFFNNGNNVVLELSSNPTNGTVYILGTTLSYVPNSGFIGQDSFNYTIHDSFGNFSTATVFINVSPNPNEPNTPIAENDYVSLNFNTSIIINVLENDSFGSDGAGVGSITVTSNPSNGTVLINTNGTPNDPTDDTFVYTPNSNYFGNDSFYYSISDANGDISTAMVYIYIDTENVQPASFEKTAILQGSGNVGDAIIYTFKVTNNTGGTMASIYIYDAMLSTVEIGFLGGLAPTDTYILNYTYIITQNDVNSGLVSNSATLNYTNLNYVAVSVLSDDGNLSNGLDNPTITYLNNYPSTVIDYVIQPSCSQTTGSVSLSNLPTTGWVINYDGQSIGGSTYIYSIFQLVVGFHNISVVYSNGIVQYFDVYIEPYYANINAGVTSAYVDYNNDGFTNVGDVINYQYNATNNGSCDLTNIGISPTPFLNLDGATIPVSTPQTTDNTTLFATHVITQQEINAGYVHLDNGLFYTAGASTYGIDVIHDTILTITNGFKLNAFMDSNNNGVQDNNEQNFSDGYFTYQLNDGAVNNIYSQNGVFYLYEVDPNNFYNIGYTINNQYNQCGTQYVLLTSAFTNLTISNNGIETLNFAISGSTCTDLAVFMNNGWFSPRPGFGYSNLIYYRNYGNQTIPSGTITFTKDAMLSITNVSESAITNNPNGFSYNFTNLLPYETRYIFVDMLVPLIPNINIGDVVSNTVTASTSVIESSLSNNVSIITDIVIGSYDPNDKNESHGGKVLHSGFTANDYLTYTIRFENTGTAEAINVKVTDVLDQKLDETSLRMVAASDDYVLDRIGSNLTWRFSGINLAPSVENTQIGHGYATFQVKPKTGYLLGDVIPNTANIYFDFNPAIVTNECTTEFVSTLAVNNFNENDFSVYPNPTKNILNISAINNAITIENIVVFDVVGKAILNQKANTPTTTIDLSNFAKGVYFVKVAGIGFEKMVKVLRE